jgi:hypothetical protein
MRTLLVGLRADGPWDGAFDGSIVDLSDLANHPPADTFPIEDGAITLVTGGGWV